METYAQKLDTSLFCREDGLNFESVPAFGGQHHGHLESGE